MIRNKKILAETFVMNSYLRMEKMLLSMVRQTVRCQHICQGSQMIWTSFHVKL